MKITFAVLLSLFALPAFSQENMVNTEIVSIALDDPIGDLFFHNGKDISTFQANLTGIGEPLKYKGPQVLAFRQSEAEFAATPPLPPPYATVSLPLNSERILLACLKSGDAVPKFIAYDISKAKIGTGDYRFFNFSRSVISVIFGKNKFAVKPGADTLISEPAWKTEVMEIGMQMAILQNDKVKPVYASEWGHRPGRRNYIFMFNGVNDYKPIKICRFFDIPSSAPPAAKEQ